MRRKIGVVFSQSRLIMILSNIKEFCLAQLVNPIPPIRMLVAPIFVLLEKWQLWMTG